jgi:hypothetical protein
MPNPQSLVAILPNSTYLYSIPRNKYPYIRNKKPQAIKNAREN